MKLEKIAVIAIVCYLAIALPVYIFNQQIVEKCEPACAKEGFDITISARILGEKIECRCLDSITRSEKSIEIE